ncbi:MAG TPA: methyltransferase domain-containing protein [Bacteroidia bacterium]|jgi:hypothetical protein|nr:methyltransferase domain-containing protein [Bacteroidia bacterium]
MQPKDYKDNFFEYHLKGALASAEAVIPIVKEYITPVSVIDIGCGVGAWLSVWEKNGANEITGVDGSYIDHKQLLISENNFIECNLENGYRDNKRYNLVTSLEVAEHLPGKYAEAFVSSLCGLGNVVLFSAAIPGQEGTMHVNEQYPEYWVDLFKKNGFAPVDCLRTGIWDDKRIQWWYRQNMLFFVKENALSNYPKLNEAYGKTGNTVLSLVHPELLDYKSKKVGYYESILDSSKATLKYLLDNFLKKK